MISNKISILILSALVMVFLSCEDSLPYDNTPEGNFDMLWQIMDDNYCFFGYKQINWDSVYHVYRPRVKNDMGNDALFTLMGDMLSELKDGHVNLIASHDLSRYWGWSENYPSNFDRSLISTQYLGNDYHIASGINYKILDDNVGYIYYGSFANDVGQGNLSQALSRMSVCKGIIIDIRGNGGGSLSNVDRIASRFFNERTLVGYISHKTGKGHNDFSDLYPKYINSYNGIRFQKKVVVLTNRACYSAANDFINVMKHAPNTVILGDKSGGGSGLPFTSELVNGWAVRFSASPLFNVQKEHTEFGIEPDIKVSLSDTDRQKGKDTLIESARKLIHNSYKGDSKQ